MMPSKCHHLVALWSILTLASCAAAAAATDGETKTTTTTTNNNNNAGATEQAAPKDYSYSPKASRVRDLAGFFESMQRRNKDPTSAVDEQDLVISLSEAASKLHLLMDGFPMEVKCNRYVKLIDRPNIRTFATVNLLANEDKQFSEIEQNDVNLLSRLQNERTFDALGKSQSIIQSLESERINMRSAFDTDVQADLLDCITYYIYRHQRATLGLVEYVRGHKPKIDANNTPASSKIVLEKFHELIEAIKSIETKEKPDLRDNLAWLKAFAKMHDLVMENGFELPKMVQEFVTNPERLERLRSTDGTLSQVDEVVASILKHEADESDQSKLEKNEEYRRLLFKLGDMVEHFGDLLSESTRELVEDPNRKRLIDDEAERDRHAKADEEDKRDEESTSPKSDEVDEDRSVELHDGEATTKTPAEDEEDQVEEKQTPDMQPAPRNEEVVSATNLKREVVGLTGKYITGYNGQPGRSKCQQVQTSEDDLMSKSVCTRHAFELSANLRLFDDTGIQFDWAKTMAESVGKFMVDCLMRSSY